MKKINITDLALEKGFTEFSVSTSKEVSSSFELFEKKLEKSEISDTQSYTLKGVYENHIATLVTEDLTNPEEVLELLKNKCLAITSKEPFLIYPGSPKYKKLKNNSYDFKKDLLSDKIEKALLLNDLIQKKDPRISKINVSYGENFTIKELTNSKGLNLKSKNSFAYFVTEAIIKDGEDSRSAYELEIKTKDNNFSLDKIAEELSKQLLEKLNPVQVPSGNYPIILTNDVTNSLISSFFSMFSGLAAIRNSTLLKDKVGEKVFGENITLLDDPFDANSLVQTSFDDEGVATKETYLVKKGVVKTLFHSLKSALMLNVEPTGHGFGGGVSFTNLILSPGNKSLDELISKMQNGILITGLSGLHAGLNPISGDFSCQAEGIKIENGKKAFAVSLIVLSANFVEMLNIVEEIGNDTKYSLNGVACPSLLIKTATIGGK